MGRVACFTVGKCQVLKPCRGLVSFVLCTFVLSSAQNQKINK